jgi:diguanylate cyclase (GGDEF)-like protein
MTVRPRDATGDDSFSLFDQEESMLSEADRMIEAISEAPVKFKRLSDAYRKSYREQQRLLRMSDRMQLDLHGANQKLAQQATELKRLNETLQVEVERREALTEELRRLASTDALTGLASRRHALELAEHEFRQWQRTEQSLAIIIMDLDHFKSVNDRYGHLGGDIVLKGFGAIAQDLFRESDVIGRWGGEEFLAVLPATDLISAIGVAERLRLTLEQKRFEVDVFSVATTVSIGVTVAAKSDKRIEQSIGRADLALYDAKARGRNRVVPADATELE